MDSSVPFAPNGLSFEASVYVTRVTGPEGFNSKHPTSKLGNRSETYVSAGKGWH